MDMLVQAQRADMGLGGTALNLQIRSQIGQALSIAMLGGFRNIVANFVWIEAHRLWEERMWYKIKPHFDIVVLLQPRVAYFWDTAAWHMAWNISWDERRRCENLQQLQAPCVKAQEYWIEQGRRYLENGLLHNPNSWELNFKLGWLIKEKQPDRVCDAVPYFQTASEIPDAPRYIARHVGFAQEDCGQFAEAYRTWLRLWDEFSRNPRSDEVPRVIWERGRQMEEVLQISDARRFFAKISEQEIARLTYGRYESQIPAQP